ncbi:hypothetical protein BOTBODRAFT_31064 [Botryobasidium botryosum FD-172 SS1]|uniref:Uncharacterized protein n=1 Tax=Botryobasidium botryosum (strain FD-172 SS1) TaxID=930990 RepID=A0A067MKV3_BOTB1|nr:hypothetical protein BOTBODRAFT_31064 [Botryobasidium botryosum FD-172 SS1]
MIAEHHDLNQFSDTLLISEWKDLTRDQQCAELDKHIDNLGGLSALPVDRLEENNVVATVRFITPGIHTWIQIHTMDGHAGQGSSGALGAAVGDVTGVLNYSSWDTLTSAPNTFAIASAGMTIGGFPTQGIVIKLSIGGKSVGAVVAGGTGVGAFAGLSETVIWSPAS